ncbi:MAG: hypothetical protein WA324_28600 [Bryobacteraceae bacterium]
MPKVKDTQPDKNVAVNEHPVPSQAEGDRETVEQDLKRRDEEQANQKGNAQSAGSEQR